MKLQLLLAGVVLHCWAARFSASSSTPGALVVPLPSRQVLWSFAFLPVQSIRSTNSLGWKPGLCFRAVRQVLLPTWWIR